MRTIISGLAGMLAGSVGWWLGSKVGFATGVILSLVVGPIGAYYGRRWFDDNLG